jgi:hypothetical protein
MVSLWFKRRVFHSTNFFKLSAQLIQRNKNASKLINIKIPSTFQISKISELGPSLTHLYNKNCCVCLLRNNKDDKAKKFVEWFTLMISHGFWDKLNLKWPTSAKFQYLNFLIFQPIIMHIHMITLEWR